MGSSDEQDPTWLLLLAAGVVTAIAVKNAGGWLHGVVSLARSALVPGFSGGGVALVAVLLARWAVGRRLLAGRRGSC